MALNSTPSLSTIERLYPHLLTEIGFHLGADRFLGPPTELVNLLGTSRAMYNALSLRNNNSLCSLLFYYKFDTKALARRLSARWETTSCLASEFRKRIAAMQRMRHPGRLYMDDLWTAYLMMTESDGKNEAQLIEWAKIEGYLARVLHYRVCTPYGRSTLWLAETEGTSLIMWLMWMTIDRDLVRAEEPRLMQFMLLRLLHNFMSAGFQYPSIHAPDSHFYLPLCPGVDVCDYNCSGPSPKLRKIIHYSHELKVATPPLTPVALLLATIRIEFTQDINPIPESARDLPQTRAIAQAINYRGATLEDLVEFNYRTRIHIPARCPITFDAIDDDEDEDESLNSRRYDADWHRVVACHDLWLYDCPLRGKLYTPGSLSGQWAGRFVEPYFDGQLALQQDARRPPASVSLGHQPMYITLHEHHCLRPDEPLAGGVDEAGGDDILNAWLPRGTTVQHLEDAIEVLDPTTGRHVRYETFFPNSSAPYSKRACEKLQCTWDDDGAIAGQTEDAELEQGEASYIDNDDEWEDVVTFLSSGVADILVTGETTEQYGNAWGRFSYFGRVRPWDGLIVLLRTPIDPIQEHSGRWVFKGYIHDRNFVGRWRDTATRIGLTGFEGGFVVAKVTN